MTYVVLLAWLDCHSGTQGLFMGVSVRHCLLKNQLLIFVQEFWILHWLLALTLFFFFFPLSDWALKRKDNYQFVRGKWENICLHFLMELFSCKPEEWMRAPKSCRQGLSQPVRDIGWWMSLDAHLAGSLGRSRLSKSQAQTTAAHTSYLKDEGLLVLLFQLWGNAFFLCSPDKASVEGSEG